MAGVKLKRASIDDVASLAAVSKTSISNFLNGKTKRLSPETCSRIQKAIERLRYQPRLGARRNSSSEASKTLGLLYRQSFDQALSNPFFVKMTQALSKEAQTSGYRLLAFDSGSETGTVSEQLSYAASLAGNIVDGYLIFELECNDAFTSYFDYLGLPYLAFGALDQGPEGRRLASDHEGGLIKAVRHFVQHGYTSLACFPGPGHKELSQRRIQAFQKAIIDFNLANDEQGIYLGKTVEESLALAQERRHHAYLLPQDHLRFFRESYKSEPIPPYILLDYFPHLDEHSNSETYLHINCEALAKRALEILQSTKSKNEYINVELVAGRSCGCTYSPSTTSPQIGDMR